MQRTVLLALRRFAMGGAERVAADILAVLQRRGCRTIAVAIDSRRHSQGWDGSAEAWFAPHAEVRRLADGGPTEALRELVARENIDTLVLSGRSGLHGHLPALKAAAPSLRIVSFMFNARQLVWEHRRYGVWLDAIVAESEDAARALNGAGDERLPIQIVSSGVDVHSIARRPIVRDTSGVTIGFVGRFDRSKNPAAFVALARRLRGTGAHFVMAGPAPPSFRAPPYIRYAGVLGGEEKEAFLDGIDILVVPSLNDGRPLIIHELQARGAAIVASRVGAIPELVEHEVSGLLVPPGDFHSLVAAVERAMGDNVLRDALGAAAKERALVQGDMARSMPAYLTAILGEDLPAAARDCGGGASDAGARPAGEAKLAAASGTSALP